MKIARLRALTQHSHKCVDQERIRRNEDCPTEGTRISMKTKSSISSLRRRDAVFTDIGWILLKRSKIFISGGDGRCRRYTASGTVLTRRRPGGRSVEEAS